MMFKLVASSTLLACSSVRLSVDSFVEEDVDFTSNLFSEEEIKGQCPKTIAEVDEPLQTYFDRQRVELGLLGQSELDDPDFDRSTGNTQTCTKRDVCLLMRQLDMDFYQRARAGTLTDMDFDTPPELAWMHTGNCDSALKTRGKRFKPVVDADKCKAAMSKTGYFEKGATPQKIQSNQAPAGCVIEVDNKKRGKHAKAYLNVLENSTATAGPRRVFKGRSTIADRDTSVQVLCEMDRSLSQAAATYYSPYKLKQSMVSRPQMSTSCSFGMYAYLAKLKETKSSCAKLLTAQTSGRFYSAQDALDQAAAAEKAGKTELASEMRAYVEDVRAKFVLIDTIANKWCPGVWEAAQQTPQGTCDVPRKSHWSGEGAASKMVESQAKKSSRRPKKGRGGRMGQVNGGPAKAANADRLKNIHNMLDELDDAVAEMLAGEPVEKKTTIRSSDGKPHKMALSESICSEVEDQTLASILDGVPTAPPDFFRDAHVPEGDEHPSLSPSENEKYIHN